MRALEVFGFKHYLSGPSDHPVDAPDGTSESMLSSGISRNIFIWVLVQMASQLPPQPTYLPWIFKPFSTVTAYHPLPFQSPRRLR